VQNRFLKLLVTQLQNQDPLNPLDNAAVTTQLSQINTVTGIERLNATLETLLNTFNDGQAMQAAALIGKSVLVAGSRCPWPMARPVLASTWPGRQTV
jgi:flagellar basal-body rod modification protein FlgD